jgi:heterodisulfide reductase subunit A-like polyferredoxin
MEIPEDVRELGRRLGVALDEHGFCRTRTFEPLQTSREGIFAVGPFREPKDIPESVVEASGAAAAAGEIVAPARWTQTEEVVYPPERDVSDEELQIGVFVCHCGSNIGGYLDVPGVAEYALGLSGVVHAEHNLYTCSQDSIQHITEQTREMGFNRVVVASCTPLTHEPLFQDSIRQAGLNPGMFQMANIRNQCSWVHSEHSKEATEKAKDLVRMAVAKARRLEPLRKTEVPVEKAVLVIGGGVAGMTAALTLSEQGFPVHLVEREAELGGNLRKIGALVDWETNEQMDGLRLAWSDPQDLLHQLVHQIDERDLITVHLQSDYLGSDGFAGSFTSHLRTLDGEIEVRHGATVVATGGVEYRGPEYGYGSDPRIVTQQEFEARLSKGDALPDEVTMILCVGPAERYCSRICCTTAIKNALALKLLKPEARVTIIYHDIRTYGFKERLYDEARRQGVVFVQYDFDRKPDVGVVDGDMQVTVWESSLHNDLVLNPDLLVLGMPMVSPAGVEELATRIKAPLDLDGFFLEAHVKLRPVDFATEGVFLAGAAHYPKFLDEAIVQAKAAAARAITIVGKDMLEVGGVVAQVDELKCVACLTCVRICPYDVPQVRAQAKDNGRSRPVLGVGEIVGAAYIEPAQCHGCGICVSECPAKAIQLLHYRDEQIEAEIMAVVSEPMEVCE